LLAVDARGYVWRVYEEHWSMAPSNPDNEPIPQPVTYYAPVEGLAGPELEMLSVSSAKLRLGVISDRLERLDQQRWELQDERRALALMLVREGMSEREVGRLAGVTGVAIHQWKEAARG
jgi:uncharacterized small protein (DUF1192 family)